MLGIPNQIYLSEVTSALSLFLIKTMVVFLAKYPIRLSEFLEPGAMFTIMSAKAVASQNAIIHD